MMRRLALVFVLIATQAQGQSPPVGNQMPVQPAKTTNYTVTSRDLRTIIPMNCSSACTVTMPTLSSSFPRGYPVQIQMIGSANVTISSASTIYGAPLTSGSIALAALGNCAYLTADSSNQYFATLCGGSGGGGGGAAILGDSGGILGDSGGQLGG